MAVIDCVLVHNTASMIRFPAGQLDGLPRSDVDLVHLDLPSGQKIQGRFRLHAQLSYLAGPDVAGYIKRRIEFGRTEKAQIEMLEEDKWRLTLGGRVGVVVAGDPVATEVSSGSSLSKLPPAPSVTAASVGSADLTQPVRVFVSSTYNDLKRHRVAVREALVRMGQVARGMEYFGSRPEPPKVVCLEEVRSCGVYIGLIAMRYGSLDPATGRSLTHLEYEEAQKLGLPSLIYLLNEEEQPWLLKDVDKGEDADRLTDFKTELMSCHTVSFFTTPDDLAGKVTQDLSRLLGPR